ncbi:MAG: hypothetical protein OJJ54_09815 [Pseudonocardia sp.]|nr:hypothetical protein [Pseudonocardia sp.]
MSTAEYLARFGLRYAAGARAVVGVLMAIAAPLAAPPAGVLVCSLVAVVLAGWSLVYLRLMLAAPRTWVWVTDVALMCALCLAQPVLVDPSLLLRSLGWVSPIASLAVVALQWHVRLLPATLATAAVCVAFVVGASASPGISLGQALLAGGIWTAVEAALSRLLWGTVRRGGRIADEHMAERFAAEREAELGRARRAGQRAHWATVHDTAASTLLMVGVGGVRGDEEWLPAQVRRDVEALRGEPGAGASAGDVVRDAVAAARIAVDLRLDGDVDLPGAAAGAIRGAVAESLQNVQRHALVTSAVVDLRVVEGTVRVTVRDAGRGFDPAAVPDDRFGLVRSVHERMANAGGRAVVESAPGCGTAVRLEWPHV